MPNYVQRKIPTGFKRDSDQDVIFSFVSDESVERAREDMGNRKLYLSSESISLKAAYGPVFFEGWEAGMSTSYF